MHGYKVTCVFLDEFYQQYEVSFYAISFFLFFLKKERNSYCIILFSSSLGLFMLFCDLNCVIFRKGNKIFAATFMKLFHLSEVNKCKLENPSENK